MKSRLSLDALVFDFDGLILDTEWPKFTAVSKVFADHGVELPIGDWRDAVGRTDARHWTEWLEEAAGHPVARDAVRARALSHSLGLLADEVVRPGVIDLLDEADRRDIGLAVASSSPRDWVGSHLERLCLLSRFDVVVTRDDVGATKPAPDLYLAAMAALDTSGSRSVAFEDSTHGCTSAVTAGLFCVVAPNRLTDSQDFSGADLVVSSLAEVDVAILVALMHGDPDDSSVRPTEP
jgi:HAD superfamily hydrolase (TIGR01509 family)